VKRAPRREAKYPAVARATAGAREKAKDLQPGKAQKVLVKGHQAVAPRQGEGRQVGVRPEPWRKPPADQVGQDLVQALGFFQKRNPRA
jgi:hypothetical protein